MRWAAALFWILALASGCRGSGEHLGTPGVDGAESDSVDAVSFPHASIELGRSVEGREIRGSVHGSGRDITLIVATIHGDEAAGTPLVLELERRLREDPPWLHGRKVILVPIVNPDGFSRRSRRNANRVDLNRNFRATNWRRAGANGSEPLSEPESRALADIVERHDPDKVLSIHQPAYQLDWDGPGEGLARAMGRHCSLPVKRLGSRPGSLGSWVGNDRDTAIVTVELPRHADRFTPERAWSEYGDMLIQAIVYPAPLALESR